LSPLSPPFCASAGDMIASAAAPAASMNLVMEISSRPGKTGEKRGCSAVYAGFSFAEA
jgi:hypothetical protein